MPSTSDRPVPPRDPAVQRRVVLIALGVVVLAAIAAVVAIVTTRDDSPTTSSKDLKQVQSVEVVGEPLPSPQPGTSDNSVGLPVPQINGKTFGSRSISIKKGKPTLVIGINRADPDVQGEVEAIVQWHHAYLTPSKLNVVTVITGPGRDTATDPVSSWLVREEWPFPVLVDDAAGTAASALGFVATPGIMLVDPDGVVVFRVLGPLPIERLAQEIKERLGLVPDA